MLQVHQQRKNALLLDKHSHADLASTREQIAQAFKHVFQSNTIGRDLTKLLQDLLAGQLTCQRRHDADSKICYAAVQQPIVDMMEFQLSKFISILNKTDMTILIQTKSLPVRYE